MANTAHLAQQKLGVPAWNLWRRRHQVKQPNFREADLFRAHLAGADLTEVDLSEKNLIGTNFASANLTGTDLNRALIGWTILGDVDLSAARGLDTVWHRAPSIIGLDTLYRSKGQIPEVFLRGSGVPDEFITYIKSLVGSPFQFYSCFINYSSKDQEFAERLHADLQSTVVRCWFAPHDVQGGRKLHDQIDQAIRIHERLLLILSAHSM
jgi:hypothetical protein